MANINVHFSYPRSEEYEYTTELKRVNLDLRRISSISNNKGFIVSKPQSNIKKQLKDPDGIYSTKFGQTLRDLNPFADRYKCECGHLRFRINNGTECPICKTKVKYVDDDFSYFGWIVLKDPYHIIHPNLYKSLENLIGKDELPDILKYVDEKDLHGHSIKKDNSSSEPFKGIGIMEFKERFVEILDYYVKKKPAKADVYQDIMNNIDKVFIQSVPVYTALLRPFKTEGVRIYYEGTNALYNMIVKYAAEINNDQLKIFKKRKPKEALLFNMNKKYIELYKELEKIVSGKKGTFRTLFGGRYNFTSRSVIVPNPDLRIDEVTLPYQTLVVLLQQQIINILVKSYNTSYAEARDIWAKSQNDKDKRVYNIIKEIIRDSGRGIPVLINRNPTIAYGGILQMFVVNMTDSYTMGMPLQILPLLAADFDGDVLNILYIINKAFFEAAFRILNPRNAFYINRNDGKLNPDVLFTKDTLINANAMIGLARKSYSKEQLEKIKRLKES